MMTLKFRSIDGSSNNLTSPTYNQTNADFTRVGPANFADGYQAMVPGPNPRTVSNFVSAQAPSDSEGGAHLVDHRGIALSGMMYAWGQFVDHDLGQQKDGGNATQDISITVPAGDPVLPDGSVIHLTRVAIDPNTGKPGTPATAINTVTGWLDGSQVYGSTEAVAASLRTADGHMKETPGHNLPIVNGQYAAGDARAAENPDLTALHTLFVREHNYQVDRLHALHPDWSGDQLYQMGKAITTAEMVNITYSEFLPHLLGVNAIPKYQGYNPSVDPRISEEFAGAAFRFGHSIVSDEISATSNWGEFTSEQTLAESFFEDPSLFEATGADGLLRHLTGDLANPLDTQIVDGLRNLLFDPPDGIDLAAINIQRAHDLGLGSLNQTRVALGLKPHDSFASVSSDPATQAALKAAYGTVDKIDLWTGGLAEDHTRGAVVGQTFGLIIAHQFAALRDGDRFYFENQGFDATTLRAIKHTSLSDLIMRDTDTTAMQADAFVATERHSGTLAGIDPHGVDAAKGMAQLVVGSEGADFLYGGDMADTLYAAGGSQTLTGGRGGDTFVFDFDYIKGPANTAEITDYNPQRDHLVFAGDHGPIVKSSDGHGGTLLTIASAHEVIDIIGIRPSDVHYHSDFIA